jgi:hypothetical protein
LALVLRILLTRSHVHRSEDRLHGMSFQKDRSCQCRLKQFRRTVFARTPPPAFLFPDQRFQRPRPEDRPNCLAPVRGGGGYLAAPVFGVKQFFLKNFLFTKPSPEERRRRLSSESRSPCQPGFSAFLRFPKPKLQKAAENRRGNREAYPQSISAIRLSRGD